MPDPVDHRAWGELKRVTFELDAVSGVSAPRPGATDAQVLRHFLDPDPSPAVEHLYRLLHHLDDSPSKRFRTIGEPPEPAEIAEMDHERTWRAIRGIFDFDRLRSGHVNEQVANHTLQRLCRRAYALALTIDGWPTAVPLLGDGRVQVGLRVRSLTGEMEGRTTGGRRRCPAHGCPGWLVGVLWESGQQLHICSEGWHYDPETTELRVVGGGEISARFVSPEPLGVPPWPREQWIPREELVSRPAWSASANGT